MLDDKLKQELLKKLARGIPLKTACQLLRIEFSILKEEIASNKEFDLDIEQYSAMALEKVISALYSEALDTGKFALEYLKKRDAETWSDTEKRELIREQERIFLLELLRDNLPTDTFVTIMATLETAIENYV
jgi:hypothetical protein